MRIIFFLILLSSNVFALAVTPSQIDFTHHSKANLIVFNTEDYVKDFSLTLTNPGFFIDQSSLRIPPRSNALVNLSSSCKDCEAKLYIRELSNSPGIKVEPAVMVKLSSGDPPDLGDFDIYEPTEVTSFSFLDISKPEIIVFILVLSITLLLSLFFIGRKFYIKKLSKKLKRRKKK